MEQVSSSYLHHLTHQSDEGLLAHVRRMSINVRWPPLASVKQICSETQEVVIDKEAHGQKSGVHVLEGNKYSHSFFLSLEEALPFLSL